MIGTMFMVGNVFIDIELKNSGDTSMLDVLSCGRGRE